MKVIYGISPAIKRLKDSILTIGVFDGVHLGHQYIIQRLIKQARKKKRRSILLTFHPHPQSVLTPKKHIPLLVPLKERLRLISELGIDLCIVLRFNKRFASFSAFDFVRDILLGSLKMKELWVGEGFRFGKDKRGNITNLKCMAERFGFRLKVVRPIKVRNYLISSTNIRNLVKAGRLKKARQFLGRPFSIKGKVIKGAGWGRKLGFPTANIQIRNDLIPPAGVYLIEAGVEGKKYNGLANIGTRPAFLIPFSKKKRLKEDKRKIRIEAHLLKTSSNLYRKKIEVFFLKRLRAEKRFFSAKKLTEQISRDIQKASPPNI